MNSSNVHELGLSSLVYVSRSTLREREDAGVVEEIVKGAVARNEALRLTGALIYTELHFAQLLEGPARSIKELMSSIRADSRHRDVTVVAEQRISERKFGEWAMAYSGPSSYLDRHIKPLLSPVTSAEQRVEMVERLMSDMQRLHAESTHAP